MTGQIFGRLTATERIATHGKHTRYKCICTCGTITVVNGGCLSTGNTRSCGCLHADELKARCTTHDMTHSAEYKVWVDMWQRTTITTNKAYAEYKHRAPPELWRDFSVFYAELGPRPSAAHTLDRINNDEVYGPGNCRWATTDVQANNTRRNVHLTFQGKTQTLSQWTKELNLPSGIISSRIKAGWSTERALTEPSRQQKED